MVAMARRTWLVAAALVALVAAWLHWREPVRAPSAVADPSGAVATASRPSPDSSGKIPGESSAGPANTAAAPALAADGAQKSVASAPAAAAIAARTAPGAAVPRVTLSAPPTARSGAIVEVRVDIDVPPQSRAVVVALRYDPVVLQLVETNEGELISRPGGERSLDVQTASGQADLSLRVQQGAAIEGTGTLAQVTFNALRTADIVLGATIVASPKSP
jgi:hypothetical protein